MPYSAAVTYTHPHPGPPRVPRDPCTVCSKGVTGRSKSLDCDICERWKHIRCTYDISIKEYDSLVESGKSKSFIWNKCIFQNALPIIEEAADENINADITIDEECDNESSPSFMIGISAEIIIT